ncbi:beta-3-deoxy-D-manno-oct-2-ulosonic acid transferase [uncultured Sphingomonas sp.]|uniref:capsular polysaccharide export protein, LipB/KpsS family n=1 Tax=uncultured Sphingomonas sp. TaxID=158754 RepID=UPI0025F08FE0|nr:beta-3-deoxy-D-manno-oct-2-ulosonic acid transferase [uncultured Sphingomonas sp.]
MTTATAFLRVPPFPRARATSVVEDAAGSFDEDADAVIAQLRACRVGGSFWGGQPALPETRTLLFAPRSPAQLRTMLAAAPEDAAARGITTGARGPGLLAARAADPWWLTQHCTMLFADAEDEIALVGALAGCRLRLFGSGRFARLGDGRDAVTLASVVQAELLTGRRYRDPFTGAPVPLATVIAQLGAWRALIDGNRDVTRVLGVAGWKRETMEALLWDGGAGPRYRIGGRPGGTTLLWRSRVPPAQLDQLATEGAEVGEIEDGFVRSTGLGANCVPPLSITVDRSGVHFDPRQPSDLEALLEAGAFAPELCARAEALMARIVAAGLSKYGRDAVAIARPAGGRRHVLVTGQVEDDRSVQCGGGGMTNLDLLMAARAAEPDAYLIYKPHPDVEAGHRKGAIDDAVARTYADQIERDAPISALLDMVDGVHVLTSLAGFEALLRSKQVTTHGVPFYAGWGLTRDLGPIPARRTARRSLAELVAAVLIVYPRYLDPVTRLPCEVELLVERMIADDAVTPTRLERLRILQGKAKRSLARFGIGR